MSQGNKSVVSEAMQNLTHGKEDLSHQIGGHKANLHNPNTTEESKVESAEAIGQLQAEADKLAEKRAAGKPQ